MQRSLFYITGLLLLTSFWISCANIVAPTGGPKDETAPLLKKRTLKDSALNFKGGRIQFEFDEFLQAKDIENQLVITPLLAAKPKVTVHKKKAAIYIADSLLLPNTTYKISLGNAIQDLHEGNAVKDLSFTFSTGKYFDSLSLSGIVYEAETGKQDTASWVLLYTTPVSDSVLYKRKPLYVQKVRSGMFKFESLPNKEFAIFSLRETNNNLKYDAAGERVSFYPEKINPADTQTFVTLYSFVEREKPDTSTKRLRNKQNVTDAKKNNVFGYSTNIDTVQKAKRSFNINDSVLIAFSDTIINIDKSKIRLFQGENFDATATISIDTSQKKIIVKTEWVQDAVYKLVLLKSFAENNQKLQTLPATFIFKTKKESDYGYLNISTDTKEQKVIFLLKDEKVIAKKNVTDTLVKFSLLTPGDYQLQVLKDNNGNDVWDTGNLIEKQMPEVVTLISEPITIKANWGNKIDLHITEPKRKSNPKK